MARHKQEQDMRANRSPWPDELQATRQPAPLDADTECTVAIVGGGIAGVATAFFLLRDTAEEVVLVEARGIADGATGYNAGQLVSYFERPLSTLVEEYGFDLAIAAQREIDDAWSLLEEMHLEAAPDVEVRRFTGHMGMWSEKHLAAHLRNNRLRQLGGLSLESCVVSNRADVAALESEYGDLFDVVPQDHISGLLETADPRYRSVLSFQKGTANSLLLCERVVSYLQTRYADRFRVFEGTTVKRIELEDDGATLISDSARVRAGRVILCTNGYLDHEIVNRVGVPIDTSAQQQVKRTIGFMAAWFVPRATEPAAVSFLVSPGIGEGQAYFYMTKRAFRHGGKKGTLVCIGGPDLDLAPAERYDPHRPVGAEVIGRLDEFVRPTLGRQNVRSPAYHWTWHGVMGYTRNGVRVIGADPRNPVLLYNFGCNGVGLLPSICGARRVARLIAGDALRPSIFDPS